MVRRRSVLALWCAGVVGCSRAGGSASSDSPSGGSASGGASGASGGSASGAAGGWQSRQVVVMGHSLMVEVGPLVVMDGSTSLLPVRVSRPADDPDNEVDSEGFNLFAEWKDLGARPSPGGVRLVDAVGGVVWRSTALRTVDWAVEPGGSVLGGVPFGAVGVEAVTVMLPQAGFVDVGVVQRDAVGDVLGRVDLDGLLEEVGHDPEYAEPVVLERFSKALDESSDTRRTEEEVRVNVSGDVVFATDSAELSAQADAVLASVAAQIGGFDGGGSLTITGHTDDVAEEGYNQGLSERRAQAVAGRLGSLTDLSAWQVSVSGKGETQPRVEGTDEEARAANRRVEVVVAPAAGTGGSSAQGGSGELPAAQGPVASGAEGVSVRLPEDSGGGEVMIRLPQVVRRGGYLFGEVEVTGGPGGSGDDLGAWFSPPEGAAGSARQEGSAGIESLRVTDGLTLAVGGQRLYVADYKTDQYEVHISLTELYHYDTLAQGRTTTLCAVWPDTGQDTVTLDYGTSNAPGATPRPWRLTDIPVTNP